MRRFLAIALQLVLVTCAASWAFAAAPPRPVAPAGPMVQVDLVSEVQAIPAGQTFWIALRQRIAPGWHTYWVNPGDSGEPPRIEWSLPAGFTAGEFVWPYPERIPVGIAMSFGYSREVVLPLPITAPADLAPGSQVTVRGQASWLVCEKECIPEEAPVAITLPVATGTPQRDAPGATLIDAARRAVPTRSPWPASFTVTPDTITLQIAAPAPAAERISDAWFFPGRWGVIENAAPQRFRADASGITLEMTRGALPETSTGPIEGVVLVSERLDGGGTRHAFALRAEPRPAAAGPAGASPSLPVAHAVALALAGGLILNLMPCVLPVLSVKALGLLQHGSGSAAVLRRHGIAYTAGVLVAFAVVAGALLALRAAGEQLGWGFQLQSPSFVTLLAFVLFVMALALSGVVVIGGRFTGAGHALAERPGYAGSFFTGALAAVAATPCTAPFMGAAVGFAVTQPWTTALLVFEALALGLALPYLLLTLVPAWRRFLPRPGPWMRRFEQVLAFPLYGSVAWLVWVVSQQAGPPGVAVALAGLVLIGFAAWLFQESRGARAPWRRAATAAAAALAVVAVALGPLTGTLAGRGPATARAEAGWEPFSDARLAELRAKGTPVFVNVTAAWCITCLVNERVALRAPAVVDAFARKGVVALKADWTTRDPGITRVLGSFGRSGVPLYLFYPPHPAGGPGPVEPTVLPQILTEATVIEAIGII